MGKGGEINVVQGKQTRKITLEELSRHRTPNDGIYIICNADRQLFNVFIFMLLAEVLNHFYCSILSYLVFYLILDGFLFNLLYSIHYYGKYCCCL